MVCVWPPQTSMNLYRRPGSHSSVILADRARAFSASRNSSTYLIPAPLVDLRRGQRRHLVGVRLADAGEEGQRGRRLLLVDLRQREADVDEDPVAGYGRVVGQQPDVDGALHAADV